MAKRGSHERETFACPHCGEDVEVGARFCRACGASEESGWDDQAAWGDGGEAGYGEDDEFDYGEYVRREFPQHAEPRSDVPVKQIFVAAVVGIVCLAMLLWTILG